MPRKEGPWSSLQSQFIHVPRSKQAFGLQASFSTRLNHLPPSPPSLSGPSPLQSALLTFPRRFTSSCSSQALISPISSRPSTPPRPTSASHRCPMKGSCQRFGNPLCSARQRGEHCSLPAVHPPCGLAPAEVTGEGSPTLDTASISPTLKMRNKHGTACLLKMHTRVSVG